VLPGWLAMLHRLSPCRCRSRASHPCRVAAVCRSQAFTEGHDVAGSIALEDE